MRKISFPWGGEDREFTPNMAMLSDLAADLSKSSGGAENTASLAGKLLSGGADPVFAAVALFHMLRAAGAQISKEDAYIQILTGSEDMATFRQSYIATVLPSVDFGKKPEAPAA